MIIAPLDYLRQVNEMNSRDTAFIGVCLSVRAPSKPVTQAVGVLNAHSFKIVKVWYKCIDFMQQCTYRVASKSGFYDLETWSIKVKIW